MATQSSLKPLLAGALCGALLTMVLGFTTAGWVTSSKAESTALESSKLAVIQALAPICLSRFEASADATAQRDLLKKTEDWKRPEFVKTGGWAKLPGVETVSDGLARKCAELISAAK